MSDTTPSALTLFKLPEASVSGAANTFLNKDKSPAEDRSFSNELSKAVDHFKPSSRKRPNDWSDDSPRQSTRESGSSNQKRDARQAEAGGDTSSDASSRSSAGEHTDSPERTESPSVTSSAESKNYDIVETDETPESSLAKKMDGGVDSAIASQSTVATIRSERLSTSATTSIGIVKQDLSSNNPVSGTAQLLVSTGDEKAHAGESATSATTDNSEKLLASRSESASVKSGVASRSSANNTDPSNDGLIVVKTLEETLVARKISSETAAVKSVNTRELVQNKVAGIGSVQVGDVVSQARLAPQYTQLETLKTGAGRPEHLADSDLAKPLQARLGSQVVGELGIAPMSRDGVVSGIQNSTNIGEHGLLQEKQGAVPGKLITESVLADNARQHALNEQAAQKAHVELVASQDANLLEKAQAKLQVQINQAVVASGRSEIDASGPSSTLQSPSNTYLSIAGGIVTAPVATRMEAGAQAQVANAPLNIPLLSDEADSAMASNIRWMVNEGVKNAVVNVTPGGMGPIKVQIEMENEQMNVSILAAQGSTREALDAMLPRLRDQLMGQGHENVRVDVSDGKSDQSRNSYAQDSAQQQQGELYDDSGDADVTGHDSAGRESSAGTGDGQQENNADGQITATNSGRVTKSEYDVYV